VVTTCWGTFNSNTIQMSDFSDFCIIRRSVLRFLVPRGTNISWGVTNSGFSSTRRPLILVSHGARRQTQGGFPKTNFMANLLGALPPTTYLLTIFYIPNLIYKLYTTILWTLELDIFKTLDIHSISHVTISFFCCNSKRITKDTWNLLHMFISSMYVYCTYVIIIPFSSYSNLSWEHFVNLPHNITIIR